MMADTPLPLSNPPSSTAFNAEQQAILLLWQRVNASLTAYYKLTKHYGTAVSALAVSSHAWQSLGINKKHLTRHDDATTNIDDQWLTEIETRVRSGDFNIIFAGDVSYPAQLLHLFDPPPLLFCRGDSAKLNQSQVAIVGSRKPSQHAQKITFDMAQYLAQAGFIITSGLAQGVDAQAHLGALSLAGEQAGRTVGVMGTGIDVCYPKQHKVLFDRIVAEGGCIISELLPGTPPNKFTFPRRNRIVAGMVLGTIVTEAALKSGSLITANLTSSQGKQVFALPSNIDNKNAEGCHHLIREGATLIYHPDQIIDDLSHQLTSITRAQKESANNNSNQPSSIAIVTQTNSSVSVVTKDDSQPVKQHSESNVPPVKPTNRQPTDSHIAVPDTLQPLWLHMDWEGQDLDALIVRTQLTTPELLSQLMTLELMGLLVQKGGRYHRV